MRRAAADLTSWLTRCELALYSQADGTPRHQMLDRFKNNPRSVLFGTDSFWQGVDVPGDALLLVIITKLPFSVPDRPLLEARLEKDEILAAYLNRVYLGDGTYGVEAAAHRYFGKSARKLSLQESAIIAGLLKAPSRYAPTNDLKRTGS